MKRIFKSAEAVSTDGLWGLALDGRRFKTPAKKLLEVPSQALAEALAAEWNAQGEKIKPETMQLTQLCCTALDLAAERQDELRGELLAYAGSDLLCYRAQGPAALRQRQEATWQPLLDWIATRYDAPLLITEGLDVIRQPEASLVALSRALAKLDVLRLTALSTATQSAGSLVIALALMEGRLTPEQALNAAEVDALFQREFWGEDAEALARHEALAQELEAARRFFDLLA